MTVDTSSFNFSDAYRTLQPLASREIVAARESSHDEIVKQIKTSTHVLDLCRFAFGLSVRPEGELATLLIAEVRKGDAQFSLTHDRMEADRIAALVLTERLARHYIQDAIAVLAVSFAGLRASADEGGLTHRALTCLAQKARAIGKAKKAPTITYPMVENRSALVAALDQLTPQTIKPLAEALIGDDRTAVEGLAKSATAATQELFLENQRLAEEIDLLWWHIGDWSECLDQPLAQVPERGRGLIAGADLAAIIRALPGPYGATGILRRSLGSDADQPMKLSEAVEALSPEDLNKAYRACTDTDILPIHTAVQLYVERGRGVWGQAFEKTCGLSADVELSPYKIALQAFWESSLVKHSWAK